MSTPWGNNNVTNFYLQNRNKVSDLYKSEKILLKKIKKNKIKSVLDFGCAAAGFKIIFDKIFKKVKYTGIDSDKKMINLTKKRFQKKTKFIFSKIIPKKTPKHDMVFSTGVIHHIKDYKKIINQMLEKSKYYTFIDCPRLHEKKRIVAKMDLSARFIGNKNKNIVNYYVENINHFLFFIKNIYKKNNITIHFYIDNLPYSKKYVNLKSKVFFLSLLIEKNNKNKINIISPNKRIKKKVYEFFKK